MSVGLKTSKKTNIVEKLGIIYDGDHRIIGLII